MNLFLKYGLVSDIKSGFAKVYFPDDKFVSDWLPLIVRKTKTQKESWQLETNEHVVCLMTHDCDEGVIIGAIPSDKDAPDPGEGQGKFRKLFSDGTLIEYDLEAHRITIDVKGDLLAKSEGAATVQATGALRATSELSAEVEAPAIICKATATATVEAPVIALKGQVTVTGSLSVAGSLTAGTIATTGGGSITSQGNMSVQGDIAATGSVKAGGVDLSTHKHIAPSGGGATGPAIP